MKYSILTALFGLVVIPGILCRPASDPATPCDPAKCKHPDCRYSSTQIPGDLPVSKIPQIVMVSFDDAVNGQNMKYYQTLFPGVVNPNGCPISATFFVSHEWTDYVMVNSLYHQRHAISDHTITHRTPIPWWKNATYTQWQQEIVGQREILNKVGFVALEDVKGFRAPFLQIGGENEFKVLHDAKFLFESSMPTPKRNPPLWPYTFDYSSTQECVIPPCPKDSYPGLWEVPMIDWLDLAGAPCSMVDACAPPGNEEEAIELYMKNFETHYATNRAPFPMFFHATWFAKYPHTFSALSKFFQQILSMKDVWIVNIPQAIEWIQNPTTLDNLSDFAPWKCDKPAPPLQCDASTQTVCGYDADRKLVQRGQPAVHYLFSCLKECLKCYPWVGDPSGTLC